MLEDEKIDEIIEEKVRERLDQKVEEEVSERVEKKLERHITQHTFSTEDSEEDSKESVSRRGFLKKMGAGAAGIGALAMLPSASAFNIRTSNPLQYFGNDQNNPNFSVQPDGTLKADTINSSNEFIDPNGTSHTGELADASENIENFSTNGNSGEVPVSQGNGTLSMSPPPGGGFDTIEVFESDGTFDASNVDTVFVECVGGGGGSSGIQGTNGASSGGGGGGGGGYAAGFVDISTSTSVNVIVGSGGSGGSAGDNAGSSGGNSSFGTNIEASGGSGGSPPPSGQASGGSGISGEISIPGGEGCAPLNHGAAPAVAITPPGGGTVYAQQSVIDMAYEGSSLSVAESGRGYGGGADGPAINDVGISESGANGAQGVVIVYYKA